MAPDTNRHPSTAVEKQRAQLERLLKEPARPVNLPPPPQEKTIRPAREMMKNVQGSSAGAGSGEFHVYKASRRREYERLKLMEEATEKETLKAEYEKNRQAMDAATASKTAKNRAKRQRKKERERTKNVSATKAEESRDTCSVKKRRLVNGQELVFKKPDDHSGSDEEQEAPAVSNTAAPNDSASPEAPVDASAGSDSQRITIHDDD